MTRTLLLFSTLFTLTIISCTSSLDLESSVSVIDHSTCAPGDAALIKLVATGGTTPYVYTLWDLTDNSMIVSEKTDEGVVIVGKKDLRSIDYKFVLTDSEGQTIEKEFQVTPVGASTIASQLTMEKDDIIIQPENIEIQLMLLGDDVVQKTTYTDSEGMYSFSDLAAGNYTLEVVLHEKYDDFILVPRNANTKLRVEPGTHYTRPFALACNENFEAGLVITN